MSDGNGPGTTPVPDIEVRPEELAAAAAGIRAAGALVHDASRALLAALLEAAADLPGPDSARAAHELCGRWGDAGTGLAEAMARFAASVRATASDLAAADAALAASTPRTP